MKGSLETGKREETSCALFRSQRGMPVAFFQCMDSVTAFREDGTRNRALLMPTTFLPPLRHIAWRNQQGRTKGDCHNGGSIRRREG